MAKAVAKSPVKKTIVKKSKLKDKKPKPKTLKAAVASEPVPKQVKEVAENGKAKPEEKKIQTAIPPALAAKYPILSNEVLIKKFLDVTMTNNQKGRIRQVLKDAFKGTADSQLPDVINNKIQSIVKEKETPTESDLKRIRILYNMLKLSLQTKIPQASIDKKKSKNKIRREKRKKQKEARDKETPKEEVGEAKAVAKVDDAKEGKEVKQKVKGPKRYVVFVGNLAVNIDKEKLMKHFSEISDFVVDVRIPKPAEGKKSGIAYLELKNESSYELALSKHHTMLDNRRINVLYSTQQNSKISITEAKSKSAKLIALQKTGKLAGSVPVNKKRGQRRMKAKLAQGKQEPS